MNGKAINISNGAETAGQSGLVRCRDENTGHVQREQQLQNGKFMGVCAGIADYTGIDVVWIRVAAILLTLMTGWALIGYLAMGFLAEKKPALVKKPNAMAIISATQASVPYLASARNIA